MTMLGALQVEHLREEHTIFEDYRCWQIREVLFLVTPEGLRHDLTDFFSSGVGDVEPLMAFFQQQCRPIRVPISKGRVIDQGVCKGDQPLPADVVVMRRDQRFCGREVFSLFENRLGSLARRHVRPRSLHSFSNPTLDHDFIAFEDLPTGDITLESALHFCIPCEQADARGFQDYLISSAYKPYVGIAGWKDGAFLFSMVGMPRSLLQAWMQAAPGATIADKDLHLYVLQSVLGFEIIV